MVYNGLLWFSVLNIAGREIPEVNGAWEWEIHRTKGVIFQPCLMT